MGNSQDQNADELRQLADEHGALRRVAVLVARGAPSTAVFRTVAEEVGALFGADATAIIRFEPDEEATLLGAHGKTRRETGTRFRPDPRLAIASVRATGRAVRIDANGPAPASVPDILGTPGIRSVIGVPIVVEGRVWGALGVAARRGPLPDIERRLTDFTELVATAIANAQAHSELTASRARIVTTADQTRRRIERDLHDGAQQELVSLALQLQTVRASVPPELDELAADLDRVAARLSDALDHLREIARGIHPAILAEGGLAPALKALARRSPVPVDLMIHAERQLPEPVEVGAYYVVSEALTSVAKHGRASAVKVAVESTSEALRVLVRDDGTGGADFTRGTGLQGLKDRVEALGGRFSLRSPYGAGTTLRTEFPLTNIDSGTPGNP
jgi:signal transduction histidine kinase